MKKLMALLMTACLGFSALACSNAAQEGEEASEEPLEASIPAENEVALSMTYPQTIGDMEFLVAGTWEKIEGEDQLAFNTGFSSIIVGVSEESDPAIVVERLLSGASIPASDLVFNGDVEEVEKDKLVGSKESITVGGMEGEVFLLTVGERTYAVIALYPDKEQQAAAFEATDTLFSSMRFIGEEGKPLPDEENPETAADQADSSAAGQEGDAPSEGQASQG